MIKALALPGDVILEARDHVGPISLIRGTNADSHIEFAASITLRYSDAPNEQTSVVSVEKGETRLEVSATGAKEEEYIPFRI